MPIRSAVTAITANSVVSVTMRRRASARSTEIRSPVGNAKSAIALAPASEYAFGNGDHVARRDGIVRREIAFLKDPVQTHGVRARSFAFLAIELGVVGCGELVGAAGREHRVEHGHALAVRYGNRLMHRTGHAYARKVFMAA